MDAEMMHENEEQQAEIQASIDDGEADAQAAREDGRLAMATIPVIHQGTPEGRALRDATHDPKGTVPERYVWVGEWASQHIDGGGALGSQAMGMLITGQVGYTEVFRRCLHASRTVFEPEARNKIGGLGAYRDLPPTQETIDATIADAVAAVETGEDIYS